MKFLVAENVGLGVSVGAVKSRFICNSTYTHERFKWFCEPVTYLITYGTIR